MTIGPRVIHVAGIDAHLRIPGLLRLREEGFEIVAAGSCSDEQFRAAGIPFYQFPLERFVSPLADRRSITALREIFAKVNPRIVHGFSTKPSLLAPLAARDAGVPIRLRTVTGLGYVFASSSLPARMIRPFYCHLQRRACQAAHRTVFQNSDDRKLFQDRKLVPSGQDVLIAGSGVDFEDLERKVDPRLADRAREEHAPGGEPIVLMVSRLVKQKGVLEFLQAADALRELGCRARFLLVGPLVAEGRQAVSARELERFAHAVTYLGVRSDIPTLMSACDMLVLPTYYREGVPRVLLEAGVLGLPVITTDVAGCRDVVENESNGLLVTPRDAAQLAAAIGRLAESEESRRRMGENHRERVRRLFSMDVVTGAYSKLYRELMEAGPMEAGPVEAGPIERS